MCVHRGAARGCPLRSERPSRSPLPALPPRCRATPPPPHTHTPHPALADITRILKPRDPAFAISGMKCLLLDKDTKTMVSMVTSMHDILSKQVFLVENLESPQPESVGHMKAIIIARPTKESLARLAEHLKSPKFVEYHLFFTNIVGSVRGKLGGGGGGGLASTAPRAPRLPFTPHLLPAPPPPAGQHQAPGRRRQDVRRQAGARVLH